eukprot:CCRYP_013422-RA/>CCRYP_013422-RA protein AED:0.05 eAED:0.05 QI:193/1/1/1/0/0/2/504/208
MTSTLQGVLSLTLLFAINFLVYFKPSQLIGFLHGPKTQIEALHQWHALREWHQAKINSAASWTNDMSCHSYNESYQQSSSFRDAGVIASLFSIITILFPNFVSMNLTKSQRLHFIMVFPSLWITSGLFGQILSKTIPVESYFLSQGIAGWFNTVYCSLNAVVSGPVELSLIDLVVYEFKVVGIAAILLFLLLGVVPIREEREDRTEVM